MPEQLVTAYSGTTLENFKICATQTELGLWVFDKDREQNHYFKSIFFVLSLKGAIQYACQRAKELKHNPLAFVAIFLKNINGLMNSQIIRHFH